MNNTQRSLIGIAIGTMIGATTLVELSGPEGAQAVPASETAQAAAPAITSTYLVPTSTTTAAAAVRPAKPVAAKPAPRLTTTSTTAVEGTLPERLTPEQEATIQAGLDASDEANACNPDVCEHLPQDYDLPSETSTRVDEQL